MGLLQICKGILWAVGCWRNDIGKEMLWDRFWLRILIVDVGMNL